MTDHPLATVPQLDPGDVVWPGMSFEVWRAQGPKLGRLVRGVHWVLCTWLLFGERHFGERFAQAVAETGLQEHSIMTMLSVARAFPDPAKRHPALSFAHHATVAGLDDIDAQEAYLAQAEAEGWSVTRLRQAVRGAKGAVPSRDEGPQELEEFWRLFHSRWGSDRESPEYNKAEWQRLQLLAEAMQRR